MKKVFIDTNILLYAYDVDENIKHKKAKEMIYKLWEAEPLPFISIQVLQEFHFNLQKKVKNIAISADLVRKFLYWNIIENTVYTFEKALLLQERYKISFWDANIIAAAQYADVEELWSEDLQHNQSFDSFKIVNPFLK